MVKKTKILAVIILLFSMSLAAANAQRVTIRTRSVNLFINTGVAYNFKVSTDYESQSDSFFFDIPLHCIVDIRFIEWFSIYTGLEVLYGLHTFDESSSPNKKTLYYIHNLFLRIPIMVKFYPFVYKERVYSNFYLGVGGFLHFWVLNYYYLKTPTNDTYSGNSYSPAYSGMPPGTVYTPANIGFRFSVGNHFEITERNSFGVEIFANYLFIPYINGYYFDQNYNRGYSTILEFNVSVGILFSVGISLFNG